MRSARVMLSRCELVGDSVSGMSFAFRLVRVAAIVLAFGAAVLKAHPGHRRSTFMGPNARFIAEHSLSGHIDGG